MLILGQISFLFVIEVRTHKRVITERNKINHDLDMTKKYDIFLKINFYLKNVSFRFFCAFVQNFHGAFLKEIKLISALI